MQFEGNIGGDVKGTLGPWCRWSVQIVLGLFYENRKTGPTGPNRTVYEVTDNTRKYSFLPRINNHGYEYTKSYSTIGWFRIRVIVFEVLEFGIHIRIGK